MKIFISGSIGIKSLKESDILHLKELIEGDHIILIGDAYGVDKAVQQYLSDQNYQNVIVYVPGEKARNNIGNWQIRQIPNPDNLTGRHFYRLKDKAMADDCDIALVFWDGKSKGTKNNMDYVIKLNKDYLVL